MTMVFIKSGKKNRDVDVGGAGRGKEIRRVKVMKMEW